MRDRTSAPSSPPLASPLPIAVVLALLQSRAPTQSLEWLPVGNEPRARQAAAIATDPIRNRPLAFSGFSFGTYQGGLTWTADLNEWDGTVWRRRTVRGPSSRQQFGMVTDVWRGRVVLFGGATPFGDNLDDTWEFDGTSWQQRTPAASPPASSQHAMAFDLFRGRTVLTGASVDGTWEWNGTNWSRIATNDPAPRYQAAMTFDPRLGTCLMAGGMFPGRIPTFLGETWTFDGTRWTQLTSTALPPRFGHAMAYDPVRNVTVLYGGTSLAGGNTDTFEFTAGAWLQRQPATIPLLASGPALGFDPDTGRILLTGSEPGPSGGLVAATWLWDGTDWTRGATDPAPAQRELHGFVADVAPGAMLLFGGHTGQVYDGETWRWRDAAWQRLQPAVAPAPRGAFGIARDTVRNRIVLFGGFDGSTTFGDTWEWDGTNWRQATPTTSPSPRFGCTMSFDAARGVCVLFGRDLGQQNVGETWTYDGTTWTLASSTGPGPRHAPAMTFDAAAGVVVLFGGSTNAAPQLPTDLWQWNGANWTPVAPTATGPAGRVHAAMAHDGRRGRTVLHGGQSWNDQRTWERDSLAGTWSVVWTPPVGDETPVGNGTNSLAFEPLGGRMLLFDGAEVWTLTDRAATATSYGAGCGTAPRLGADDRPFLGATRFALQLDGAPRGSLYGLWFDFAAANVPLPGGCTLLLAQPVLGRAGVTSSGLAFVSASLPIPTSPSFLGAVLFAQAGALDPAAPPGFSLSNGLRLALGD